MAFEQRVGFGSLFRNRKASSEKAPQYRGDAKVAIDGHEVEIEIAGWMKLTKNGDKFLSLSVKQKGADSAKHANGEAQRENDDLDF